MSGLQKLHKIKKYSDASFHVVCKHLVISSDYQVPSKPITKACSPSQTKHWQLNDLGATYSFKVIIQYQMRILYRLQNCNNITPKCIIFQGVLHFRKATEVNLRHTLCESQMPHEEACGLQLFCKSTISHCHIWGSYTGKELTQVINTPRCSSFNQTARIRHLNLRKSKFQGKFTTGMYVHFHQYRHNSQTYKKKKTIWYDITCARNVKDQRCMQR